jgi:hypothetical protein
MSEVLAMLKKDGAVTVTSEKIAEIPGQNFVAKSGAKNTRRRAY